MSNIKQISIFTDASFKAETRIAGTGVVITNGNKRIIARKFRTHGVLGIAHAELIGVLNGFELLYVLINGSAKKLYKQHIQADILSKSKKSHKKCPKWDKAERDRRKAESQRAKAKNNKIIKKGKI